MPRRLERVEVSVPRGRPAAGQRWRGELAGRPGSALPQRRGLALRRTVRRRSVRAALRGLLRRFDRLRGR